jgi:hypothetical protein
MYLKTSIYILVIMTLFSCGQKNTTEKIEDKTTTLAQEEKIKNDSLVPEQQLEQKQGLSGFLPKGYLIFEKIYGDLNKDGSEDCVIIIKGTDKNKIVNDKYRGVLDKNRRGIIVLFNKNDNYELAIKNHDCFSSENEDGGVYFAPELSVDISEGNLHIRYGHGRYGSWGYTFRFKNSDFELIGYDSSESRGPVVNSETSVNFLTKKKQIKVNINESAEGGDEVFKETWENIQVDKLVKLSVVKDFDELNIPY